MTKIRKGSPVLRWLRMKILELFSADLRSLAVFRMVLAVLALADLATRLPDLYAHYTDEGVLPRGVLLQEVLSPWAFSVNLISGKPFFQALLFGVTALATLALLVGYRTRLMTFIVWVMLLSIQWRNPLVGASSDTLLRMLFFWGMFLPLGAHWSVDRTLKAAPPRVSMRFPMRFLSLATFALFMQIASMYWFSAILKSGPEWRWEGTALYYALGFGQIATPIGAYLHEFPTLLKVLTFATLGFEAFGPFLLFFPVFTAQVRTGAILAFMSFHLGIWLTMDIGIFPWISAFCMVCFLPSWFWEKALPKLGIALPKQTEIAYRLRRSTKHLLHAYGLPLREKALSLVSAEQPPNEGRPNEGPPNEGVTAQGGDNRAGYITQRGASLAPTGELPPRQEGTQTAAENPAEQGMPHDMAAQSTALTLRSSFMINLLALFFLFYVFCWNLTTVSSFKIPEPLVPLGPLLGLEQDWVMFAPGPPKDDGWYLIPGTLRSGQQVELLENVIHNDFSALYEGVSWYKPPYLRSAYGNEHWRKYLEQIRKQDYADQRLYFSRYICREWNARHTGAEELTNLQITFMEETTLPDYQRATPKEFALWEHSCF